MQAARGHQHQHEYANQIEKFKKTNKQSQPKSQSQAWNSRWRSNDQQKAKGKKQAGDLKDTELSTSRRSQGKSKRSQESLRDTAYRDGETKDALSSKGARMSDAVADLGTQLVVH